MKISAVNNCVNNYSYQNLNTSKINFKQAPAVNFTTASKALGNPAAKKVFIRLAQVIGLTSLLAWVSKLNKKENDAEKVQNLLKELSLDAEQKTNEYLLNPDTINEYLQLSARADEIESALKTKGENQVGTQLDITEGADIEIDDELLFNPSTRDTYINNRQNTVMTSLIKQANTISNASEAQRAQIISTLDAKIAQLSQQAQALRFRENNEELMETLANIAKMQSILAFMKHNNTGKTTAEQIPSIEINTTEVNTAKNETVTENIVPTEENNPAEEREHVENVNTAQENNSTEDTDESSENVDTTSQETAEVAQPSPGNTQAEERSTGVKVVGKIDLSSLNNPAKRKGVKTRKTDIGYIPQEVIVTPRNEKFVDAFNYTYKSKNGAYPLEAYGNRLDFIKDLYDSYGRKENVKEAFITLLTRENMNLMLDKYQALLRSDSYNLDFINYVRIEKIREAEGGKLTQEEFNKISDYKNNIIKYLYAMPEDVKLSLAFSENVSATDRLKYVAEFHKMVFNAKEATSTDDFREPIEMGDVKAELIKRLVDNPSDYPNILDFLGIQDTSEICIQLSANDRDEAEAVVEELLLDPEVEANLRRLTDLLNNDNFSELFASTHSRMRLIERYVLNDFETVNYDHINNDKAKEKEKFKLDKNLNKAIVSAINSLKREIQYAKEIDIYNYRVGNPNYKAKYDCFARIILYDNTIGLNKEGKIDTLFIND